MEGYIQLHRKILDWEWWEDRNTRSLFFTILLLANWKDKKWRGKIIKRGSFITTVRGLAKKAGLTPMQTRTSLKKLKLTHEVTNETSSEYTVITVLNYNDYQTSNTPTNKPVTHEQHTSNTRVTHTNKDNKDNKVKKNTRKHSSLSSLTDEDIEYIAKFYDVPVPFVRSKYDDLINYCKGNGRRYKDYKATLMNWVKRDAISIKTQKGGVVDGRGVI